MQIYKNVAGIGFFVKANRRFVKRMETHKFVHTNLLMDPHRLKMGNQFGLRIVAASAGCNTNFIFC